MIIIGSILTIGIVRKTVVKETMEEISELYEMYVPIQTQKCQGVNNVYANYVVLQNEFHLSSLVLVGKTIQRGILQSEICI
jgi:hypothetical protein